MSIKDIVDNEKANVRWVKQQVAFESRAEPPTPREKELIQEAEKDLAEQERLHNVRVQHFEQQYKQQY